MTMYVKQLNGYTVAQLKEELTNRALEVTGKKAELVVRLAGYLEEHPEDEMVEALALGELPKRGTPSKADREELDTSEIVEEEEDAADVTNGDAEVEDEEDAEEEADEEEEAEEATMEEEATADADASLEEDAKEAEESTKEEKPKENGDDTKDSEMKDADEAKKDDDAEKKKEEKKEEKKKPKKRVNRPWPRVDEFQSDKRLCVRQRTLVIGPLDVADLDNETIRQIANEAEAFTYKTSKTKDNKNRGVISACLKDKETCEEFVERLAGFKEDVRIEQCRSNMSQEKFYKEITKVEEDAAAKPDRVEMRTAIIKNLPEDCEGEKVKELFPEIPNIRVVKDEEGKCKGWGYVEFPTSKEGQEFVDTYRNKKEDERPQMDDEVLRVGTLQGIIKLYVEVKKKEEKEKPKELPEGMLSDEDRVKKPQLIRMWKQRLTNLEPLKKTRPEYYEKQKTTLEENIKQAEELIEKDDAKRKELGIPVPDAKKLAEKKEKEKKEKEAKEKESKPVRPLRPLKRKISEIGNRSGYRPPMKTGRFGSMTREQWQQRRSGGWGNESSGAANPVATANAVNLLVGLSKIFGGNQKTNTAASGGTTQYEKYSSSLSSSPVGIRGASMRNTNTSGMSRFGAMRTARPVSKYNPAASKTTGVPRLGGIGRSTGVSSFGATGGSRFNTTGGSKFGAIGGSRFGTTGASRFGTTGGSKFNTTGSRMGGSFGNADGITTLTSVKSEPGASKYESMKATLTSVKTEPGASKYESVKASGDSSLVASDASLRKTGRSSFATNTFMSSTRGAGGAAGAGGRLQMQLDQMRNRKQ